MRVLVAYESKYGSTKAIAERISETLVAQHHDATVQPIEKLHDLAGYDAFVIGSAVYHGGWLDKAVDFVRNHELAFAGRPVWLFSSGPLGTSLPADPKELPILRDATNARGHHVFYGALDRRNLSVGERLIAGVVKAPEGDFRDWTDIGTWAEGIARELDSVVLVTA